MTTSPPKVCLGACALIAALASPPLAGAACLTPAPTVVWSYPAEGQLDVPTNAAVWLLLSNGHTPEVVFIDEQPVPANEVGVGFQPPQPLAPGAHLLSFLATPEDADLPVQLTLRFTTGAGPSEEEPPEAPFVTGITVPTMRALAPRCQAAVQAMGCADTGADTHLVFANPAAPLLWIVERVPAVMDETPVFTAWPGDCGLPELFTRESVKRSCGHRYRLHAAGPTGLRSTGKPVCPDELLAARPAPDGGVDPDDPDGSISDPGDQPVPGTPDAGAPRPAPAGSGVQVHESTGDVTGGCDVAGSAAPATVVLPLIVLIVFTRRRSM
jgi:hypothetical protein